MCNRSVDFYTVMAEDTGCISKRAATARSGDNFFRDYEYKFLDNPYHPQDNSKGIVNLGVAENSLCEDVWLEKFNQPEMSRFEAHMQYYFTYGGLPSFRNAIAEFLTERFHASEPVSPNNVVVSSGCGAAMDYLMFCLADAEEYFLLCTPCYYAIPLDISFRSKNRLVEVPLPLQDRSDAKAYEQNVKDVSAAYTKALAEGKHVKGVIVINPHNPTGNIVRLEKVREIIDFCAQHKLHAIVNEIYGLSTFGEDAKFQSVLSLESVPDPDRLHLLWGFSKDFALSGLRCGVMYSRNKLITEDRRTLEQAFYYGSVPALVQDKLRLILTDKEWLDGVYFPANKQRMRETYTYVAKQFREMGVPSYKAQAGFFIFIDLREFLSSNTAESELELFREFFQAGLYILPGTKLLCREPGWFRVTFSLKRHLLDEGFQRIRSVIQGRKM